MEGEYPPFQSVFPLRILVVMSQGTIKTQMRTLANTVKTDMMTCGMVRMKDGGQGLGGGWVACLWEGLVEVATKRRGKGGD